MVWSSCVQALLQGWMCSWVVLLKIGAVGGAKGNLHLCGWVRVSSILVGLGTLALVGLLKGCRHW